MEGLDLYLMLQHQLDLEDVLDRKQRHAAETGEAFIRIDELFPGLYGL
jgi:hypothetical protein